MLAYSSTPIQEIHHPSFFEAGIRVVVKREDLNHPNVSGNKWWKLKYNLEEAKQQGKKRLLTFGGAFSNHIFSTAAAASELRFKSIGIIRGEEALPLNATLSFVKGKGMELHYISREDYRKKEHEDFLKHLQKQFGDFYLIPEGGTNQLAVKGCAEFAEKVISKIKFDHLFLPVGTGGTLAGIVCGLSEGPQIWGVSVLKKGEFLVNEIEKLIQNFAGKSYGNWSLLTSYHHGGYAKVTQELTGLIEAMNEQHDLPLDPVYTGKLMWAVVKEAEEGRFKRGSTVLVLHTGGLQSTVLRSA